MLTLVDFESQLIVIHGQFLVTHSHSGNHYCIVKMYLHTGLTNNYKRWGDTYGFMHRAPGPVVVTVTGWRSWWWPQGGGGGHGVDIVVAVGWWWWLRGGGGGCCCRCGGREVVVVIVIVV